MNEPHERLGSDKDRSRERVPPERPVRIDILTIFPEMFETILSTSIPGRARASGPSIRSTTFVGGPTTSTGRSMIDRSVEDRMVQCASRSWTASKRSKRWTTEPRRESCSRHRANTRAGACERPGDHELLLIAGHYEGIDERVIDELAPLR